MNHEEQVAWVKRSKARRAVLVALMDKMTAKEISEVCELSESSVYRAAKQLIAEGLIEIQR